MIGEILPKVKLTYHRYTLLRDLIKKKNNRVLKYIIDVEDKASYRDHIMSYACLFSNMEIVNYLFLSYSNEFSNYRASRLISYCFSVPSHQTNHKLIDLLISKGGTFENLSASDIMDIYNYELKEDIKYISKNDPYFFNEITIDLDKSVKKDIL